MTVTQPGEAELLRVMLRSPGYLKTLLLAALVGIPVSLAAFWFLAGMHELEHLVWSSLPRSLGFDAPPWWWPLPLLLLSGVLVGLIALHLPGAGGHIPAAGMTLGGSSPGTLPGVLLAAAASLPLGATLGPEAPLIALGGGLAVLLRNLTRAPSTPQATVLMGAAGAGAAIAAIFGSPLIAAVLLIEVVGVGGPQLFAVMLPALLSSGIGSLVFLGFGRWTGLDTGTLGIKKGAGSFPRLDAPDVLWGLLLALVTGLVMYLVSELGRRVAVFVTRRTVLRTALCALAAGACGALYALLTGRTPVDVSSSGQGTLVQLTSDPQAWGTGALVAVVLFKCLAYALCLGSLRGGPVFPAVFLGAAAGVLVAPLPGLGLMPAMAAGMAASTATMLRLPVSSVVLVTMLLGSAAMTPVVILAAVVAFVVTELLPAHTPLSGHAPARGPAPAADPR
ncbi:chloride channel protein [Streptomyces sp. NPDC002138]|uniref:chloride channel protein n=1 Tax=Streptomyces sp. NPDC002138 TaxID=3154410 RepID=UPI003331CBDA